MNIIVTGASNGIGYETVKSLCKHGNHTIIAIARSKDKLSALQQECSSLNPQATLVPITFDLSDVTTIDTALYEQILEYISHLDILINNAGALVNKPFQDANLSDIQLLLSTNYIAPAILIRSLLPLMGKGGHILNISSMGGLQGSVKFPGLAHYSSSKAAIATLTECLAEELREVGIHCNALALGAVNTEMLQKAFPGYEAPYTPQEMGFFIADFAVNQAKFFNGKIVAVSATTP